MESETQQQYGDEEEQSQNAVTPGELIGFVLRAAKRHLLLGLGVGGSVAVLGLAAAQVAPQKYQAESRILVEDTARKTSALSNPNSSVPKVDATGGTIELLLQKSSLMALAKEANLLAHWERTRLAPLRAKDWLFSLVLGPISDKDKLEVLAEILQSRIWINRNSDILTIKVFWHEPQMATTIARLAQQRFLDSLRSQEVKVVQTAISILEDEAARAGKEIDPALQKVLKAREETGKDSAPAQQIAVAPVRRVARPATTAAAVPAGAAAEPPKQRLSEQLEDIREQMRTAQTRWQRRRAELETEMTELSATYGPEHPLVIQQRAKIGVANQPPQDLLELQQRQAQLLNQIESIPDAPPPASEPAALPAIPRYNNVAAAVGAVSRRQRGDGSRPSEDDENPVVTAAMSRLRATIERYEMLTSRVDTARIELISVQAAFEYRYVVVGQPEVPKKPSKPLRMILTLGSIAGALALGLLSGALRELASRKVHESWQVKPLGLVDLGELEIPGRDDFESSSRASPEQASGNPA